MLTGISFDLRCALRTHARRPAVAAFSVVTLAVGIGVSTAVFAVVNAVVIQAMPFRQPDRLVWMWNARVERDRAPFSLPDLKDYRDGNHVLAGLAPFTNWTANLTGDGDAERLEGIRVSTEFFDLLGVEPAYGRLLRTVDDPLERSAIVTARLWRRRFGSDPQAVGRTIVLNGVPYRIAGVLRDGFVFPFRDAEIAVPLPLASDPRRDQRGAGFLRVVARLRPGVTVGAAKKDLDVIGRRLQRDYPVDDAKKNGVNLYPLQSEIVGDAAGLLTALLAGVLLLVVVALANLASLAGVVLASRQGEFETRGALGASRGRLVRQVAVEWMAVAAAGCIGGLFAAAWLTRSLAWWASRSAPRIDAASVDRTALLFAIGVASAAALACGILPAVEATRRHRAAGDARTATASAAHYRTRRAFVAIQIAAALALIVAVGLTTRSFVNMRRLDPGFEAGGVATIQLSLPPLRYASPESLAMFADRVRPRLERLPAVSSVSAVSLLPLSGLLRAEDFRIVGRAAPAPEAVPQVHYRLALPGYFRTMRIPLVAGREFTPDDNAGGAKVAIVGRRLADEHWPDGGAIGAHLALGNGTTVEVVGVAGDVKQFAVDGPATDDLYVPLHQMPASDAPLVASRMYWVIRTNSDPTVILEAARREILAIDRDVAPSAAVPMASLVGDALAPRRLNAALLGLFGEAALLLAAIGVYAVTAFSVSRRAREIGIRIAFGATRRDVVGLVMRGELGSVCVGVAAGSVAAVIVARLMAGTLFRVPALDVWSFATAIGLLTATGAAAAYVPARRAARIDPVENLRAS